MKALQFVRMLLLVGLVLTGTRHLAAQEFDLPQPASSQPAAEDSTPAPYVQPAAPAYEPTPRTLHQQNAIARGQQRQARLASLAWYGMSNSRPTASPTPFSTMYSPAWQMPGGRPFAWHHYYAWPTTYVLYR
jgi:hypothetical protein